MTMNATPLLHALSFKQPWLYFMSLPSPWRKDFENRTRRNRSMFFKPLWAHAALRPTRAYFDAAVAYARDVVGVPVELLPTYEDCGDLHARVPCGAIVARLQLYAPHSPIPNNVRWIMAGQYAYPVASLTPVTPVACKGALNVWRVPDDVLTQLTSANQR